MFQLSQGLTVSTATISAAALVLLFYVLAVFILILSTLYIKLATLNASAQYAASISVSNNAVVSLVVKLTALLFVLYRSTKFICVSLMFGHLVVSRLAVCMLIVTYIIFALTLTVILREGLIHGSSAIMTAVMAAFISLVVAALWFSGSYYAIMFNLDCLNVAIFSLVFNAALSNKTAHAAGFYVKLTAVSVYFWTAFVASTLMLLAGVYLLVGYGTTNIRSFVIAQIMLSNSELGSTAVATLFIATYVLSLFIKSGIGPFFVWKRTFFAALDVSATFIYMFFYFSGVFMFIVSLLLGLVTILPTSLLHTIALFIVISAIWAKYASDFGASIQGFFALSTLFNAALVLCVVLAVATFTNL